MTTVRTPARSADPTPHRTAARPAGLTALRAAPLALVLFAVACGGGPAGPPGPNGGDNLVDVTVDGERVEFDTVAVDATATASAAVTLRLSGSVDPIPSAVDDEYGYVFRVSLDDAALDALALPATVEVKGELQFTSFGIGEDSMSWTNEGASLVSFAMFHRACFCAEPGPGAQAIDGTLTITGVDAGSLQGIVDVTVTGEVPNMSGTHTAAVVAEFDVARP